MLLKLNDCLCNFANKILTSFYLKNSNVSLFLYKSNLIHGDKYFWIFNIISIINIFLF